MDGEELHLHHRPWLEEVLRPLGGGLSEYCFANLYLYRHVHDYRLLRGERCFVSGRTYDGCRHLLPLFDPSAAEPRELARALTGHDFFYPLPHGVVERLDPRVFVAEYAPADSDYVYDADKLRFYRGVKLRKKRNLMHQFLRSVEVGSHPLAPERVPDAHEVLEQWQTEVGRPVAETDYGPCAEALEQMDALGLSDSIYYADAVPAGFVVASSTGHGQCVCHFAKGRREYKGVFPFMFHDLATRHAGRFQRYNFEQDLGRPNFRHTKSSYDPDRLLRKYRVRRC